jgi:hypothetical protein
MKQRKNRGANMESTKIYLSTLVGRSKLRQSYTDNELDMYMSS